MAFGSRVSDGLPIVRLNRLSQNKLCFVEEQLNCVTEEQSNVIARIPNCLGNVAMND